MIGNLGHVMTLANGIIGVSVLAMPFCFKQCGIVLAGVVLLSSSVLSRLASHFLIKSAVMSRRRNFEFLAFHAFGRTGKFLAELFIIGFLVGTCIAFFVVVGDLGPQIVGKMLNKEPEDIRTSLMVTTATFIVFPLGLLRNIDSLSSICTATIGFYLCLVLKVMAESTRHIFLGDWHDRVMYWRPAGILQCLPIFAMALFCQTQLFEIYEAIPNVCLEKMNRVVRGALNICTVVYLFVGFFGYVAFCTQPFTGNILMSFEPSLTSDLIKIGFVLSVAFSFPLVIFPCRASLNSLLFRRTHTHELSNYYIPEIRFRCLTLTIVAVSLGTGILMPNIEFVLGIVGSTIGVMICLIFPAAFFIAISTKNTNERLIAQAILFFGICIMVLGTYANLYAMEESSTARLFITTEKVPRRIFDVPFNEIPEKDFSIVRQPSKDVIEVTQRPNKENPETLQQNKEDRKKFDDHGETIQVRREPPIPVERSIMTERSDVEKKNFKDLSPLTAKKNEDPVVVNDAKKMSGKTVVGDIETKSEDAVEKTVEKTVEKSVDKRKTQADERINENLIDSDAIKKEESELAAAGDDANNEVAASHEKLRRTLEKYKLEQLEIMKEQKEILEVMKKVIQQKRELEMRKNVPAEERKIKMTVDNGDETANKVKIKDTEKSPFVPNNPIDRVDRRFRSSNVNDEKTMSNNEKKMIRTLVIKEKNSIIENPQISNIKSFLSKNEGSRNDKVVVSPIVESNEWRGPILNALTNRTSISNASNESLPLILNEQPRVNDKFARDTGNLEKKTQPEFALPIALQMSNQTNEDRKGKKKKPMFPDAGSTGVRTDNSERGDREKREATGNITLSEVIGKIEEVPNEGKNYDDHSQGDGNEETIDDDHCRHKDGKSSNFISRDVISGELIEDDTSVSSSTMTVNPVVSTTNNNISPLPVDTFVDD